MSSYYHARRGKAASVPKSNLGYYIKKRFLNCFLITFDGFSVTVFLIGILSFRLSFYSIESDWIPQACSYARILTWAVGRLHENIQYK